MKIYYRHTVAERGGFGILGKGIFAALKADPRFEVIGYNDEFFSNEQPDIVMTYGMPDLVDVVKNAPKWKRSPTKFHEWSKHWKRKEIKFVHYAVWESSDLPWEFAREYAKVDLLLTASRYTKKAMAARHLKARVWHHAVDDRFIEFQRPIKDKDAPFVFLHHNAYEFRKGWEIVLQAFLKEFKTDENVKLIMKARERKQSVWLLPRITLRESQLDEWRANPQAFINTKLSLNHPLIEEVIGHVSDEEMVRINSEADCFLFPAKGEGWGLPPFEAMAMGIVPILPNQGSFREWFDPDTMLNVNISGWFNSAPRYAGVMFYPSELSLRRQMRWAFENRDKIKAMGELGRERIAKKYNWRTIIDDLYILLS